MENQPRRTEKPCRGSGDPAGACQAGFFGLTSFPS